MQLEDFRRLAEQLVPSQIGRGRVIEDTARSMAANPWLKDPEPIITFTLEIGTQQDMYEISGQADMTPEELSNLIAETLKKIEAGSGAQRLSCIISPHGNSKP